MLSVMTDLARQITEKAEEFGTTFDVAASVILRHGLEAQSHRETEISRLAEEFISSQDTRADQLGELIFGK